MADILICDDSAVARKIIARALRVGESEVREACDGREALRLMENHPPDLLITDLVMPVMDGLELVRECRRRYPSVPSVLVTSYGSEAVASEALRDGAYSYVPKSLLERDLRIVAGRLLMIAQGRKSRERLFGRLRRTEFVFSLKNDISVISPLVSLMREALSWMGICGESDLNRAGVALEEALVNAMVHGNLEVGSELHEGDNSPYHAEVLRRCDVQPYADRAVDVRATFESHAAEFVIRDEGPGFDVSQLPDPTKSENLTRSSCRGVMLMKVFMDEVRYNAKGNEVTMIKRRRGDLPIEPTVAE